MKNTCTLLAYTMFFTIFAFCMETQLAEKELQSKIIYYLRFILIVGVIFIHSYASQPSDIDPIISNYPVYSAIRYFFSQVLGRISVPFFFLLSGFLYFNDVKEWTRNVYITKTKRRFYSLFIPYIFWNTLSLLYAIFLYWGLHQNSRLSNWDLSDYLLAYWGNRKTGVPALYTFWFIRDLIIISLLSPLIYVLCKYLKIVGVIALGFIWYLNINTFIGYSILGVFFFYIGSYLSIHKINLVRFFKPLLYISLLYPLVAIFDLYFAEDTYHQYIHNTGILLGIILLFNLIGIGIKNNKLRVSIFLSSCSFFLYATHEPMLMLIKKMTSLFITRDSEITYIIYFFVPVAITIGISLSLYYILTKKLPRFLAFIVGGR